MSTRVSAHFLHHDDTLHVSVVLPEERLRTAVTVDGIEFSAPDGQVTVASVYKFTAHWSGRMDALANLLALRFGVDRIEVLKAIEQALN